MENFFVFVIYICIILGLWSLTKVLLRHSIGIFLGLIAVAVFFALNA